MPGKIADLNVRLGLDLTPFIREIKRVESRLNKFGRKLEGIGRDLSQKVTLPLVGLGAAAVKSAADFEKLELALRAVSAEGTDISAELNKLRKIAESPGLGFDQAVKASTRLQAVGLSADEARATIEAYGKAVARSGGGAEEFDGAILALTQIASKGAVFAEEINQINERIFEIRPALKNAFGTASSEDLQDLGITASEFIRRTTEEFQQLKAVEGGLSNSFENLGQSVRFALSQLGKTISETINLQSLVDRLSKFIEGLAEKFNNLAPATQKTILLIAGIAAAIGPVLLVVGGFVGLLGTLASGLSILLSPITAVIAGIAALTAVIVIAYNRSEEFRNIVNATGKALAIFANIVINRFKEVGQLIGSIIGLVGDLIKLAIEGFRVALNKLGKNLGIAFEAVKEFFGLFTEVGNITFSQFLATVEGVFTGVIRTIKEAVTIIRESLEGLSEGFEQIKLGNFGQALQKFRQSNPVGILFREGERLGNAFNEGYQEAFERTKDLFGKPQLGAFQIDTNEINDIVDTSSATTVGQNNGTKRISPLSGLKEESKLRGIDDGFTERIRATTDEVKKLAEALPKVEERFTGLQEVALVAFDTFANGFDDVLNSAESFGRGMIKILGKVAQAAIQAAVTQVILKRLQGLSGFLGLAAVPIAAGAGKLAAGLFGKLISSIGIPFAEGGIVRGPTNALIGEAGPEAVIPLSPEKLRKYFPNQGGGGPVQIFLNDIMIAEAVERGQTKLSRIR